MKLKRMAGAAAVLLLLAVCTGALAVDTGIITAEGVNLRESPDKESNALGTLELGSEVEVLAVENGWYRFIDRHAQSYDSADESEVLERGSFNFTLALYDADRNELYYLTLDT